MKWRGSKLNYLYTISTLISALFLFCSNPIREDSSPIVSSEQWHLVEPEYSDYADITISTHENGTSTCTGNWHYNFFSYAITCNIMNGTVTKDSTFYSFVCSGTAAYPPDSTGYVESSPFELKMKGNFINEKATGSWEISFSKKEWADWGIDGEFAGKRK
jgi:hypothetical protein